MVSKILPTALVQGQSKTAYSIATGQWFAQITPLIYLFRNRNRYIRGVIWANHWPVAMLYAVQLPKILPLRLLKTNFTY